LVDKDKDTRRKVKGQRLKAEKLGRREAGRPKSKSDTLKLFSDFHQTEFIAVENRSHNQSPKSAIETLSPSISDFKRL